YSPLCRSGVCGALFSVLVLPRALARIGILVDPDGLVLVEKRPWRLRGLVRGRIPWGDVQAIVARGSAVLGVHGVKRAQERPVVDVYLRGDTAFRRLGVGLPVEVTRQGGADSARVRELVGFPAVRLRLVPSLGGGPRTGGEDLADQGPGPVRLPGARSRSALHAARPDLCHGFGARGATGSRPEPPEGPERRRSSAAASGRLPCRAGGAGRPPGSVPRACPAPSSRIRRAGGSIPGERPKTRRIRVPSAEPGPRAVRTGRSAAGVRAARPAPAASGAAAAGASPAGGMGRPPRTAAARAARA